MSSSSSTSVGLLLVLGAAISVGSLLVLRGAETTAKPEHGVFKRAVNVDKEYAGILAKDDNSSALPVFYEPLGIRQRHCGAVLLGPQLLLTAEHCTVWDTHTGQRFLLVDDGAGTRRVVCETDRTADLALCKIPISFSPPFAPPTNITPTASRMIGFHAVGSSVTPRQLSVDQVSPVLLLFKGTSGISPLDSGFPAVADQTGSLKTFGIHVSSYRSLRLKYTKLYSSRRAKRLICDNSTTRSFDGRASYCAP